MLSTLLHFLLSFQFFYRGVENQYKSEQNLKRRGTILEDITRGGALSYKEIRDSSPPPLAFLKENIQANLVPQRWTKSGNSVLLVDHNPGFQAGLPIETMGQHAIIQKIETNKVFLDRPIKCKHPNGIIVQQISTADPTQMHHMIDQAWSKMWSRDDP